MEEGRGRGVGGQEEGRGWRVEAFALSRDLTGCMKGWRQAQTVREPVAREGLQRRIMSNFQQKSQHHTGSVSSCIPPPPTTSTIVFKLLLYMPDVAPNSPLPLSPPSCPLLSVLRHFTALPARWQCCRSLGASSRQAVQEEWRKVPLAEAQTYLLRRIKKEMLVWFECRL